MGAFTVDKTLTPLGMVREAVSRIPQFDGAVTNFRPVPGGLSNSNWRLDVEGDPVSYFVKIPGDGAEEYVDFENSHAAARRASDSGVGPRVVWADDESGVEVIEFLQGYRACTNADLKDMNISRQVIDLYRRFHDGPPLPHTKTIFDTVDNYLGQVARLGVRLPDFADRLLVEYRNARVAFMASGLDLVPCHNDPMPGNFLIADGVPMRMIDFEFAANNESAYELAVMVTEYFYDEARLMASIEAYAGRSDPHTVARVQVACAVADVNWGLWGCLKRQYGSS